MMMAAGPLLLVQLFFLVLPPSNDWSGRVPGVLQREDDDFDEEALEMEPIKKLWRDRIHPCVLRSRVDLLPRSVRL
jgi:hypothetical protein